MRLNPLERGWRGVQPIGRRWGPPVTVDENGHMVPIDGFDSVCLEMNRVGKMTGKFGRVRRFAALVVVGNGQV